MSILTDMFDPIARAYSTAQSYYDNSIVSNAEKIYILESGHYTGDIFKKTLGAGAEGFSSSFPYGWTNMQDFWGIRLWLRPFGLYGSPNGSNYLKFPTFLSGLLMVCQFLNDNNNNPGAWNSSDASTQATYNASINNISNVYVQ